MSTMRKMRFAATLMEALDFSKSKIKEMERIITSFVEVITDLDKTSFNDPNKETLLQKVQAEQEEYEDKNEDILKKNDQVFLEAENVLVGTKATLPVVTLPEETTGMKWRHFKPQSSLNQSYLEKEATHLKTIKNLKW